MPMNLEAVTYSRIDKESMDYEEDIDPDNMIDITVLVGD